MMAEDMTAQSIVIEDDYADEDFEELSQKKRKRYAWEQTEEETPGSYWK